MTTNDHVHASCQDRVGRITLDRQERKNALTAAMWTSLAAAATRLARSDEVRAIVLTGAGGAFCAGNDIEMLQASLLDPARTHAFHQLVDATLTTLQNLPVPVIAAIEGPCFGAGLMLATACDLRVAAPSARFCAPPARLGLVYGIVETRLLVRLLGPARAKEMLFSARVVAAEEALRLGLVERLADGPAIGAAEALAGEIVRLSPMTHLASKRLVEAAASGAGFEPWMDELRDASPASRDFHEGLAAFFAKRAPRF